MASSATASAYPWMIRHGFSACSSCHDDPSGGELLTEFGRSQGFSRLAMSYGTPRKKQSQPLWGALPTPDWLRVGGSYRHLTLVQLDDPVTVATFPMQADLYGAVRFRAWRAGGTIGAAKVPAGSRHARGAQVTSGDGNALNLISRTHWVGYELTPRAVFRAGRLNLPFGVRVPEHILWVREVSRTDRESDQQHGVSVTLQTSRLRGEVMGDLAPRS